MEERRHSIGLCAVLIAFFSATLIVAACPRSARAHCDTLNGPVVNDARRALDAGNPIPALKWVKPEAEPEIRAAFEKALAVRKSSAAAREIADTWFFETLVRVHRAGEGAPYTGLKPADADVDPGIEAADRALESGAVDPLVRDLTAEIGSSVRERFRLVSEAARDKESSVEAGRRYVEAYVQYIHAIERLHQEATGKSVEGGHAQEGAHGEE